MTEQEMETTKKDEHIILKNGALDGMLDEMARDTGNGYLLISFGLPVNDDGEDVYIKLSKTCVGVKWDYLLKIITGALCHYARRAGRSRWDVVKDVLHTMRLLERIKEEKR